MSVALIKDDQGLLEPIRGVGTELRLVNEQIQSSPYTEPEHLLSLKELAPELQTLAIALQGLTPTTLDYASVEYTQALNFDQIVSNIKELDPQFGGVEAYIVAFKSAVWDETRQSAEKRQVLADVDKASHQEANHSGGLLKYWFGTPDSQGRNLATCFWRNKADAKLGGGGTAHREGMKRVRGWFRLWDIQEYSLVVSKNATSYQLTRL